MEEAFKKLQKEGKNDVENLMKWVKDAKVVETKDQEDKARKLFSEVPDKKNVALEKFKEIMAKLAADLKINMDGLSKKLADNGPKLMQAAMAGATTATNKLKDLVKKK